MNGLHFLIFILIALIIYTGLNYYVFLHIIKGIGIRGTLKTVLSGFFIFAALTFFLEEILSRNPIPAPLKILIIPGSTWLGFIAISFTFFLIFDILRLFFNSPGFRYNASVVSLAAAIIITVYSLVHASQKPAVKTMDIESPKIPPELSGFTIVQLSDLHLNFLKSSRWLSEIVSTVNELHPDVVVVTGDLIDADIGKQGSDDFCEILKQLHAKYGVYAVAGNHEYYAGIDNFHEIAQKSNITILKNSHLNIKSTIKLLGVEDRHASGFQGSREALLMVMDEFSDAALHNFNILLSHRSDIFDQATAAGIDLQLSGHTHAGQIPPMELIVRLYFKYPYGLYRKNESYLYTTCGTGTWGPPMRFTSCSEIVRIRLIKLRDSTSQARNSLKAT